MADSTRPDRLVFGLGPGEGVTFADVVAAAHEVQARLGKLNFTSFCRTTGGKGLHVVVPLRPDAGWDRAKPFCRAFRRDHGTGRAAALPGAHEDRRPAWAHPGGLAAQRPGRNGGGVVLPAGAARSRDPAP